MTHTHRFWKHDNGDIYALQISLEGDILGVCGPLHHSERKIPLTDFEYEEEDIDWVIENSGRFRDVTTIEEV